MAGTPEASLSSPCPLPSCGSLQQLLCCRVLEEKRPLSHSLHLYMQHTQITALQMTGPLVYVAPSYWQASFITFQTPASNSTGSMRGHMS